MVDDVLVTGTAASTSTPTLTATTTPTTSPAALSGFTYVVGSGPSATQSFSLSGSNLTAGPVTVTAPTDYEVSLDGTTFSNSVSITYTAPTLASTTVSVHLKAGLATATYNETVSITGGGASSSVAVNGNVTAAPTATLTVTPTSLSIFGTRTGAPSAAQSYALKGSNLPADVVVTAPSGYEVSLDNTTFAGSVTAAVATVQTTNGQTIYVRLTGTTAGTYGTSASPVNVTNTSTPTTGTATTANEPAYGATVTPSLAAAPASRTGFTYVQGSGPSGIQSYALTYTDAPTLTGTITVTAPASYELSTSSTFATTLTSPYSIAYTGTGASQSTTLYVRLKAGLTAANSPYNETITNDITALSLSAPVAVGGTVTVPPASITVTPTTALSFAATTGTPSAEQSYAVSAANLTANLTVTAPAGYEISLTSGTYTGTGGNTLTLTPSSGTVASTTIYVRLTGAAAGTFGTSSTPVNITHASTGATSVNKPVYGTVTAPNLVSYSLTNVGGRATSAPATINDANIGSAAAITRGAGLATTSVATGTNLFGASSWSTANLADAQTNNTYFAFAIAPTLGFLANVSSIVGTAYRTTTGPATVELLYSFNSDFANPVSLGTQSTTTGAVGSGTAITFNTGAALQNVAYPVYFRLYGYSATNTAGILYLTNNGTTPGLVVNGTTAASTQPVIATGTFTPAAVCGGSTITANYTTAGPAATGSFFVQLSDASGTFTSPLDLTTTSSTATSVTATIPATVASGTTYRVRVANTDGTRGSSSTVFTVVSNPTATIVPPAPQTLNAGTAATTLTVTETPAGTSRQWAYATTAGGPYTAISGATGLTYTPLFQAAGTYYVVVQSTFAACGTVNSNEVVITVTVPTLAAAPTALSGLVTNTGSASAAQSYVLTGTGVTAAVTVSAPTGFEVSLDGTTFAASVSASATSVNAGQTIYVRLLGTTTGSVSGNVTNTVGTVTVSVAVSGDVQVSPGLLLAEDDFDYNGQLNANGWTGTANSATIAGNITVPMYPQGVLATGGTSYQAKIFGASGSSLSRPVGVPSGATTLYAAALLNVSSVQNVTGTDYVFAFQTTSGTVSYRGRVTIAKSGTTTPAKFVFRIRAAGETTATMEATPTLFDVNTNYILVMKAENSAATNNVDRFSLYVLPVGTNLSQEPSTPLLTIDGVNVFSTIGAFLIRESDSNNPTFTLDNFRFATGWGTAVGNATYSAPTLPINVGSYYNATINNGGQATQNGAVTVENQLVLAGGKLDLNGQQLTVAGTVAGSGTLSGSATSNLLVLGTGALGTLNFTAGTQTLNNLTLNRTGTGTATLGSPLTLGGTLALTNGNLVTSASTLLTLASAATYTGGSATSFVSGPLARSTNAGAATTVFPIGKGTAYRPLTLNAAQQGSAVTYRAEQFEGNPGQAGTDPTATDGTTLTRVSRVRSFTLTPYSGSTITQPTNFQGTVTLSFGADDQVTDPTASSFVMGKRADASSSWANIGGSGSGSSSGGTLTSGTITSFSDFALASTDPLTTNNPLPVTLTSFTATRAAAGVQVAWATASEKNSHYFNVERSLDGSTFASVAKVAAQGTTTQSHTYASLDGTAPAALLYYRLRQVDLDGTVAYSPVVSVAATDGPTAEFTLAPNPTRERVSFLTAQPTAYSVRNTLGQLVRSGTTAVGPNELLVGELPAGVYFFELHGDTDRLVRKFVKE